MWWWLALGVVAFALFAPVMETAVFVGVSDFKWHARAAREWAGGGPLPTPHFLFQALLIAARPLTGGADWTRLAVWLGLACQALLAIVVTAVLRPAMPFGRETPRFLASALLALMLMLAAPVTFASWSARNLYHGYVGLAVYHNPTLLLLKPLAVLLWRETGRTLEGAARPAVLLAALTVLSGLAKPSHLIALLPATALLALVLVRAGRRLDGRALLLGIALPAGVALAWQLAFRYGGGGSIAWAPLRAMAYHDAHLGARLALSCLFPLVVLAAFPRAVVRDVSLALAWTTFVVGAAYAYLLTEGGEVAAHRNFAWSAQAALFVLFVAAARTALEEVRRGERGLRPPLCAIALAMHLVCGVYFYRHPTWW